VPSHAKLEADLVVPAPPDRALHLFTPVGERLWVDGWNPWFPAGEEGDGAIPGTVFLTEHGGRRTVWTVVARDDRSARYARVSPDYWAGIVEVRCREERDGTTRVTVRYELTALGEDGRRDLEAFARAYESYIAEWGRLTAAALGD